MLRERSNLGHFKTMLNEHQLSNSYLFFSFTRILPSIFEAFILLVGPSLQHVPSKPDILTVGKILGATLR